MIWHMYCCLLTFYCSVSKWEGLETLVILQPWKCSSWQNRSGEDGIVIIRDTAHMQDVRQTWTQALADLCFLAWGTCSGQTSFCILWLILAFANLISHNLCLICSQPANKLINNSLPSGRALKPNIQRASFWKCPLLKTCEPWTSMWAERQTRTMMSFTERFSWRMTQLSGQWLSRRPSNWNTGMFSPTLYAETIHPDAAFGWDILVPFIRFVSLPNGDIKFHFSRLQGRWRGSPQSTCEVE